MIRSVEMVLEKRERHTYDLMYIDLKTGSGTLTS